MSFVCSVCEEELLPGYGCVRQGHEEAEAAKVLEARVELEMIRISRDLDAVTDAPFAHN
jgi:hypothetical protein